ncbi:MAG TPA: hypothetical protein VHO06_02720 [Polyangia bacterium]|nr:hypothetical protein [Polyangia bacterium]
MSDVSVKLEADGTEKNGTFSPTVGSEVNIDFDPAKAHVAIDYSREDALSLSLSGELALKSPALTLGLEGDLSTGGDKSVSGTLTWDIKKDIAATAQVKYGTGGASASATLTIRF